MDVLAWRLLPTVLLALAAATDVRRRRIPNSVSAALFVAGMAYAALASGTSPEPLLSALGGAAVGLALWLPGYLLGALGAGDVKLFAAAATWLGPAMALDATVASALAGGVLALASLALPARTRRRSLPYGVAIAAGVGVVLWRGGP